MSSASLPACDQLEPVLPIRLVAWRIAEQFKTLPAEVFARSIELDDPNKEGQEPPRWWDAEIIKATYEVGVAAHVAENLKWWSLSPDEKDAARMLEKIAQGNVIVLRRGKKDTKPLLEVVEGNVAARKIFRKEFPFHEAFLKGGLPDGYGSITDLGDVISGTLDRRGTPHPLTDKAIIVAYLEGLAVICKDETRANRLNELVEDGAEAAGNNDEWNSFRIKAAEEVKRLLPLW